MGGVWGRDPRCISLVLACRAGVGGGDSVAPRLSQVEPTTGWEVAHQLHGCGKSPRQMRILKKWTMGTSQVAQQVRTPSATAESPGSVPN